MLIGLHIPHSPVTLSNPVDLDLARSDKDDNDDDDDDDERRELAPRLRWRHLNSQIDQKWWSIHLGSCGAAGQQDKQLHQAKFKHSW